MKYVWQSVTDSCSAGINTGDYSHLLLSLTPLHGVSEVCDVHPKLPAKLSDNTAWRAFCFSSLPFFLNGNCTQTPSSSPVPSKHYEAPKSSQNICTLTLHCLYVIISNLFNLNFSRVATGYRVLISSCGWIYKHLKAVWYFEILHVFWQTNPKHLIWFTPPLNTLFLFFLSLPRFTKHKNVLLAEEHCANAAMHSGPLPVVLRQLHGLS